MEHSRYDIGSSPGVLLRFFANSCSLSLYSCFACTFEEDIEKEFHPQALIEWLSHYSEKKSLPFVCNLSAYTPFQQAVYANLQMVPFGETWSYGEIAKKVGSPRASRAVGSACRKNPYPLLIPCHRIIAKDGSLGGFSCDPEIKKCLLAFEASA